MHKVVVTCDDASANDMVVADLLKKYGLDEEAIFYFPVMPRLCNEAKGRVSLTMGQMQNIASQFTIGSHTMSHRLLTRIPEEDARHEIFKSREILQQRFNQPINSFCYPRGYSSPEIQKLVQEAGYTNARGVAVGYIFESENKFDTAVTLHAGYDRREYAGSSWYDYGMSMFEQAKDVPSATYSIFLHSWEVAAYPRGFLLLEDLLKEITGK